LFNIYFIPKPQGQIVPKLEPKRLGEKTGGGYDNQRRKDLPPLSVQDFSSNGDPDRRRETEDSPPPAVAAGLKREAAPLPPLSSHSLSLGADLSSCDEVKVSANRIWIMSFES
jgi:hypothetical protein